MANQIGAFENFDKPFSAALPTTFYESENDATIFRVDSNNTLRILTAAGAGNTRRGVAYPLATMLVGSEHFISAVYQGIPTATGSYALSGFAVRGVGSQTNFYGTVVTLDTQSLQLLMLSFTGTTMNEANATVVSTKAYTPSVGDRIWVAARTSSIEVYVNGSLFWATAITWPASQQAGFPAMVGVSRPLSGSNAHLWNDLVAGEVGVPVYAVEVSETAPASRYLAIEDAVQRMSVSQLVGTAFEPLQAGRADVLVDNYRSEFSPENAGSSYTNILKPNRAMKVRGWYGGTEYPLFAGFIDRIRVDPDPARRAAHFQASDRVKDLLKKKIDMPFFADINPGSLVVNVLSTAGLTSSDYAVDSFSDTIPFAWFKEYEPLRALDDLAQFGFYRVYVDPSGVVRVRNRYWTLQATVAASYTNDFFGFDYAVDDQGIYNVARIKGIPRVARSTVGTIAWLNDKPVVPASGYFGFEMQYVDPDTLEQNTPAQSVTITKSTDWLLNKKKSGGGADRTATSSIATTVGAVSVVCTLFNGSSDPAYLTKMQAEGYAMQRIPEFVGITEDSSSQNVYGESVVEIASPFISQLVYALDYGTFLLQEYKNPRPAVSVSLKNQFPDVLARAIGDKISVVESVSAVGSQWIVVGVEHDIGLGGGTEHLTTFTLDAWRDPEWLVLNNSSLGVLDSRRLGF